MTMNHDAARVSTTGMTLKRPRPITVLYQTNIRRNLG